MNSYQLNLFSIIVANYNNGRFLSKLIETVESQIYNNWELIIVDDKSTDNSIEIIKPFLKNSKIKLVEHKNNLGAGAAFRTGVLNSKGEFCGLLGADDGLVPKAIEEVIHIYRSNPNASSVYTRSIDCHEDTLEVVGGSISHGPIQNKSLILENYYRNYNFQTFRRIAYDKTAGFDPLFKRAIDQDIFFKLEEVGTVVFLDKVLYYYRRHPGGISQGENYDKVKDYVYRAIFAAHRRRKSINYYRLSKLKYFQRKHEHYLFKKRIALKERNAIYVYYDFISFIFKPEIIKYLSRIKNRLKNFKYM